MNPTAASYIRRHPALSSESMTKWRCGYLPNDGGGDKEALWFFAERHLDVRLVWSPAMHDGEFKGSQPESLSQLNVETLLTR